MKKTFQKDSIITIGDSQVVVDKKTKVMEGDFYIDSGAIIRHNGRNTDFDYLHQDKVILTIGNLKPEGIQNIEIVDETQDNIRQYLRDERIVRTEMQQGCYDLIKKYLDKQSQGCFSEKDMKELSRFILQANNRVISKNKNLVPMNEVEGEKLVNDLTNKFIQDISFKEIDSVQITEEKQVLYPGLDERDYDNKTWYEISVKAFNKSGKEIKVRIA